MRVRIRSIGPLPTIKAWYEVSTGPLEQRTIADLKSELCQSLFNVSTTTTTPFTPGNLVIELDEFELLDSSSLNVVHENDLLIVKYKVTSVSGVKRKREQDEEKSAAKRKTKKRAISSSSSSSTSSSSSSSDSSSSTSSSTSDSDDSDSDSDSDSDTDTDTPPSTTLSKTTSQKIITSNRAAQPRTQNSLFPIYPSQSKPSKTGNTSHQNGTSKHQPITTFSSRTFVPPGEGKLSTQQRNQRRRKKRMAEKGKYQDVAQEKETNGLKTDNSASASFSTGQDVPTPTSTNDGTLALAMSMARATKNDNKRRKTKGKVSGDLSSVSGGAHRIFFTDITTPPSSSSSPRKSASVSRLVPPSERTDLPGNIIVTSVDVEAGEWGQGVVGWEGKWTAVGGDGEFVPTQREAPVKVKDGGGLEEGWDWEGVEKGWEGFRELVAGDAVKVGWVLLWKELAVHPVSFTPEVMVHAATIESITEWGVELKVIPRVEPEELGDELEEEAETLSRKHEELVGYRVYSQ